MIQTVSWVRARHGVASELRAPSKPLSAKAITQTGLNTHLPPAIAALVRPRTANSSPTYVHEGLMM